MDWRRKLAEYDAAHRHSQEAVGRLAEMERRLRENRVKDDADALCAGVALAGRRAELAKRRLSAATWALTQGRDLIEVMWSAPDEL